MRFSWTMGQMSVSEITKVNFGEGGVEGGVRFSWTMGQMSVSEITKVNLRERGGGVGEVLLDNGADVRLRDNKGKLTGPK